MVVAIAVIMVVASVLLGHLIALVLYDMWEN